MRILAFNTTQSTYRVTILKHFSLIGIISVLLSTAWLSLSGSLRTQVDAQTGRGLIVSPTVIDQDVDKGSVYDFPFTLLNDNSEQPLDIVIQTKTFRASEQEGVPELLDFSPDDVSQSWISFQEKNFNLSFNQPKRINATIQVPPSADPGGYYYAVIFSQNNAGVATENQVIIRQQVAALIFVNVRGQVQKNISMRNIQITPASNSFTNVIDPFFDPINVNYEIEVEGNTFFRPQGNIFVYQNEDRPLTTLDLNPEQKIILANSTRSFKFVSLPQYTLDWISDTPNTLQQLQKLSVRDFSRNVLIGPATVKFKTTFVNSNGELEILTATKQIFFFPWKATLIAIIAMGLLASIYFLLKRNHAFKAKK